MKIFYFVLIMTALTAVSFERIYAQENNDSISYSDYVNRDLKDEYSSLKNTSIRLRLPLHFKEFSNEESNGFMHTGTGSSIIGFEIEDTPYMLFQDSLTNEQITGDGAYLISQEKIRTYSGHPAKLFFVGFKIEQVEMIRLMFYTGSYNKTIYLQANYPKSFEGLLKNIFTESFRTVKFE